MSEWASELVLLQNIELALQLRIQKHKPEPGNTVREEEKAAKKVSEGTNEFSEIIQCRAEYPLKFHILQIFHILSKVQYNSINLNYWNTFSLQLVLFSNNSKVCAQYVHHNMQEFNNIPHLIYRPHISTTFDFGITWFFAGCRSLGGRLTNNSCSTNKMLCVRFVSPFIPNNKYHNKIQ